MSISITWHGHANFQIAENNLNILIDPFFTGNPMSGCTWNTIARPDLVLVTHMHGDHSGDAVRICVESRAMLGAVVGAAEKLVERGLPQELLLNGIGFNIGGTVEYKGAAVTMTEAFHTTEAGTPTGFIVRLPGGFTVYHAGDTGIFCNMALWGELYPIDLALLPAGGIFTMDARQAAKAAGLLKAKAVIPMHWGTFPALAQSTAEFEKELKTQTPGCKFIKIAPGQTIEHFKVEML